MRKPYLGNFDVVNDVSTKKTLNAGEQTALNDGMIDPVFALHPANRSLVKILDKSRMQPWGLASDDKPAGLGDESHSHINPDIGVYTATIHRWYDQRLEIHAKGFILRNPANARDVIISPGARIDQGRARRAGHDEEDESRHY